MPVLARDHREAARCLGVSPRWIYKRAASGELPAIRLGDGPRAPLRVDPRDLQQWLRELRDGQGTT
jgi:excisionase family DNA binding protein